MEDNMSNLKNMNVNRIIYLDKIRCIAIFLVIFSIAFTKVKKFIKSLLIKKEIA